MSKKQAKALNQVFEGLAKGQVPSFLEMMSALSDVSNIMTEADSQALRPPESKKSCSFVAEHPETRCRACD